MIYLLPIPFHLTKLRQLPALVNLNVTGDAADSPYIKTQTNAVSVTSDVLTTLTVGGTLDRVSLHGATKLTALESSAGSFGRDFEIIGASILEAATGHDHIEGSDAASRISGASACGFNYNCS